MLNVWEDNLVVEAKGIYSIEKFLIARRLMYWQVYLHKAVVSAEFMLVNVLKRARELVNNGDSLFAPPVLKVFLNHSFSINDFRENKKIGNKPVLEHFASLDDNDILSSIKEWQYHPDKALSFLSKKLVNRNLFRIQISEKPFTSEKLKELKSKVKTQLNLSDNEADYCIISGILTNSAYSKNSEDINILQKNGTIEDIRKASDINLSALTKIVRKYFLCYPKELDFN